MIQSINIHHIRSDFSIRFSFEKLCQIATLISIIIIRNPNIINHSFSVDYTTATVDFLHLNATDRQTFCTGISRISLRPNYLKKSSLQKSFASLEKHFSVSGARQSAHRTHAACHARSSTCKRNLSKMGLSQPAQAITAPPASPRPENYVKLYLNTSRIWLESILRCP